MKRMFLFCCATVMVFCVAVSAQTGFAEMVPSGQIGGFKSPTRMTVSDSGVLYVTDHKKGAVTIIEPLNNMTGASRNSSDVVGSSDPDSENSVECRKYRNQERCKDKKAGKDRTNSKGDSVTKFDVAEAGPGVLEGFIAPLGVAVLEVPPATKCLKYNRKREVCKVWTSIPGRTLVYIGDEGDGSVQVFVDGNKNRTLGAGTGEFEMPNAIAVNRQETVYVVDSKANQVKVYDKTGALQAAFGGAGFDFPTDIALNESIGELYVSDYYNKRIRVFDLGGGWLRDILAPLNDAGDPVFYRPAGLGIDPEGNLYVADNALSCVAKITSQGDLLDIIGYKNGAYWTGELSIPVDAAAFGNKVFVTSNGQRQLRIFEVMP